MHFKPRLNFIKYQSLPILFILLNEMIIVRIIFVTIYFLFQNILWKSFEILYRHRIPYFTKLSRHLKMKYSVGNKVLETLSIRQYPPNNCTVICEAYCRTRSQRKTRYSRLISAWGQRWDSWWISQFPGNTSLFWWFCKDFKK